NVYTALIPKRLQDTPPSAPPVSSAPGKRKKSDPEPQQFPPLTPLVPEVRIHTEPRTLFAYAYDYFRSFYDVLLMASFVPFLVYFWLAWGDHLRSRLLSTLEGEPRYTAERVLDSVGSMVRAYVIGNFLLGIFLSVASAILFVSVQLPYWSVVGPLSGFLSL